MKEIMCTDGTRLRQISRWIEVKTNYNPNSRNRLWDFAYDENGYHPDSSRFNPENGLHLDYFRHNGMTYAVDQFFWIGGPFVCGVPHMYENEDGKLGVIGTVFMDSPALGTALYGEWDECCEHVRLYEEVR